MFPGNVGILESSRIPTFPVHYIFMCHTAYCSINRQINTVKPIYLNKQKIKKNPN